MEEKPVISASRTKDLIRISPGRFAEILKGRATARFGLGREYHLLTPDYVGALVIWTKDPANMLKHPFLNETLTHYVIDHRVVIVLNLTVTGLGGTALEPGIPPEDEVCASTKSLIDLGLVCPEGIILRYDPLIHVLAPGGTSLGNISIEVLETVLETFRSLEIKRIKTSLVDDRYNHVPKRLEKVGFTLDFPQRDNLESFYKRMHETCSRFGARLDICCHPASFVTGETRGCIDGNLINRLLENAGASWRVTTTHHNDIGRQRRTCMCTYSRDIGYSAGFQTCFKTEGACIYCYSQKSMTGTAIDRASMLVKEMTSKGRERSGPRSARASR